MPFFLFNFSNLVYTKIMTVSMQSTSDLWKVLCNDLASRKNLVPQEKYEKIAREFVENAERILRPESARLAEAYEIAGDIYMDANSLTDAFSNFSKALNINSRNGAHAAAGRVGAKISQVLIKQARYAEAIPFLQDALNSFDAAGDYSYQPALLDTLANAKKNVGDFDGSHAAYRKAIDLLERVPGDQEPQQALLLNNLGVALTEAGCFEEAETALLQSLSIREQIFGANHPDVAHSLTNLGVLYHAQGNFEKARSYYMAAIEIYRKFHEDSAPEIQLVRQYLEQLPQNG